MKIMGNNNYIEKEEYERLKAEKEALERKVAKLNKRLNSIIKINDNTFKNIFDKNSVLEKDIYRFDRILQQSDRQGKSILVKKDEQEKLLFEQAKLALMGEMIDNIAHQWRQPLNNISIMIQTAALKFQQNKFDETMMEKFQNDTLKQINYMSDTVDDFRSFLKEDKEYRFLKLPETFKKVRQLTKNLLVTNGIELITDIRELEVYGIENELIQIFMNLISNSIDAFESLRGLKLIMIKIDQSDDDIIILFKDNAGGIKEEFIKKVFEPKFTTKEEQGGSGIGLYMCKEIINNTFNGSITLQNENFVYEDQEYKGASLSIKIPKN